MILKPKKLVSRDLVFVEEKFLFTDPNNSLMPDSPIIYPYHFSPLELHHQLVAYSNHPSMTQSNILGQAQGLKYPNLALFLLI